MLNTDPASSGSSFTIPNRLHVDALTLETETR
jgi:hypothetical protein